MIYVGGKRQRLIKDNFRLLIEDGLTQLGWLDANRDHKPVSVHSKSFELSEEILPNVITVSVEDVTSEELEMGSNLDETRMESYVDIYAEDDVVGLGLSGDIYDLLRGKFRSINDDTRLRVKDLSKSAKPEIFTCELENIEVSRVRNWDVPFRQFWWTIGLDIVDYYSDENG